MVGLRGDQQLDFERRFGGIARLYGEQGLARLAASRVCVVGVGGVGSWVVEALGAQCGWCDDAGRYGSCRRVEHQSPAAGNRTELGRAKVIALRERVALINPTCRVDTLEEFVSVDNIAALIDAEHAWK